MNITVYLVDREGVGRGAIQAQAEYALKSIIRRGASVGEVLVYVECDDSVPAAQRPRLTALVEDAARRGFDCVVISALRDLGAGFYPSDDPTFATVARVALRIWRNSDDECLCIRAALRARGVRAPGALITWLRDCGHNEIADRVEMATKGMAPSTS